SISSWNHLCTELKGCLTWGLLFLSSRWLMLKRKKTKSTRRLGLVQFYPLLCSNCRRPVFLRNVQYRRDDVERLFDSLQEGEPCSVCVRPRHIAYDASTGSGLRSTQVENGNCYLLEELPLGASQTCLTTLQEIPV